MSARAASAGEGGARARRRGPRGPFRWSGIAPIVVVIVLVALVWTLFGGRIVQAVASEAATKAFGTEVDVRGVDLSLRRGTLTIALIEIADPFDVNRNLLELGPIQVGIQRRPLLQKKLIIDSFIVARSRYRSPRATPARPVTGRSLARDVMAEVTRFTSQISVPPLQLLPIDTVQQLVLHPEQLATVKEAQALDGAADSLHKALTAQYQALRVEQRLDSIKQVVDRLKGQSPLSMGLGGVQRAASDLRAAQKTVDDLRVRAEKLAADAKAGEQRLADGVAAVEAARAKDFAFAKGLLKLPTIDGPQLGNALFGPMSIDKFQQAVYYAELGKKYVPPGLLPREQSGPTRFRMAGTTVAFPLAQHYPSFHIRRTAARFAMTEGSAPVRYVATVRDVTTEPEIVGAPLSFYVEREAEGSALSRLRASGIADHRGALAHDSTSGAAGGFALGGFTLPGLPLSAQFGTGDATFDFDRRGEAVRGAWTLRAPRVQWTADSCKLASLSQVQRFAVQVIAGIPTVSIRAELGGTMAKPTLAVRSNIDSVFAASLRQAVGVQLAKAEARARAEVDRLTAEPIKAVRAKVDDVRNEADKRVADARARIEFQKREIEDRLKSLGGGLIRIP